MPAANEAWQTHLQAHGQHCHTTQWREEAENLQQLMTIQLAQWHVLKMKPFGQVKTSQNCPGK
jgi:hypothetical protein